MNELTEEEKFWLCVASGVPFDIENYHDGNLVKTKLTLHMPCDVVWHNEQWIVLTNPKLLRIPDFLGR
jgi:hypothetical protein